MEYQMKELVPIVAKLAHLYTSGESTSITRERAQQLMEAVLYTIREGEESAPFRVADRSTLTAEKAYEFGARCVEQKVKEALALYNRLMTEFHSYGNKCLHGTVVKGLPEFFKRYDARFYPQNTMLTLDYPVLIEKVEHTGIDRIYDYLQCIRSEQTFLSAFPPELIIGILEKYDRNYRQMIDNLCEIVLQSLILHLLAGKEITDLTFEPEEQDKIEKMIRAEEPELIREKLKCMAERIVLDYYEGNEKLNIYLKAAADNISVRIKMTADNGNLKNIC